MNFLERITQACAELGPVIWNDSACSETIDLMLGSPFIVVGKLQSGDRVAQWAFHQGQTERKDFLYWLKMHRLAAT